MSSKELNIAIQAAREAGKYALDNFHRAKISTLKDGKELVTDVDQECEQIIREIAVGAYPDHGFLGEESGQDQKDSDYLWIVDPIDGTTNYARGIKLYGISIALAYQKQVVVGVVYNPVLGELFYAERGKGAFLKNGDAEATRIQVSSIGDIGDSLIYLSRNMADLYLEITTAVGKTRVFASTAYEICQIAAGRVEGGYKAASNPWGFSAGCLIVEEAGGKVSGFAGKEWDTDSRRLVISNGRLHHSLLQILKACSE